MSDKVHDFVLGRRRDVLLAAIDDLVRSDLAGLRATVHRLRGTLGTFGLGEAERVISELERSLDEEPTDDAALTTSQQTAVDGLRACLNAINTPGTG